jgi:hypothetical protein
MMAQHFIEFFQSIRVKLFQGVSYFLMDLFLPLVEQTVISHLLGQGVLEDIFEFGKEPLFVDELQTLQI